VNSRGARQLGDSGVAVRLPVRTATRIALGAALVVAGISHLTVAREEFQAQVPTWVPVNEDTTVVASGIAEITLGTLLASGWKQRVIGLTVAAFFIAVFPGNISQWKNRRDGFGLDTDLKRLLRLPFQVPLIAAALWSTKKQPRSPELARRNR
jgi:uncharacterized membrane protein